MYQDGDQVGGQVTLDNCGYRFTTETHRVARRQVDVLIRKHDMVGLSNEVVAYDSPETAGEALNEFRMSVLHCPRNPYQNSTVQGVPDLKYQVSKLRTSTQLPVGDNVVATLVVAARGSHRLFHELVIFQRRGTVLSGVYLASPVAPSRRDQEILWSLARSTGKRLATS